MNASTSSRKKTWLFAAVLSLVCSPVGLLSSSAMAESGAHRAPPPPPEHQPLPVVDSLL